MFKTVIIIAVLIFISCAAIFKNEQRELGEARDAAIAAEEELSKLRQERMQLEAELE